MSVYFVTYCHKKICFTSIKDTLIQCFKHSLKTLLNMSFTQSAKHEHENSKIPAPLCHMLFSLSWQIIAHSLGANATMLWNLSEPCKSQKSKSSAAELDTVPVTFARLLLFHVMANWLIVNLSGFYYKY